PRLPVLWGLQQPVIRGITAQRTRQPLIAGLLMEAAPGVSQLTKELGGTIDSELLVLALTHRSFAYEAGGIPTNERLEFLGDSVVGIITTEELYLRHDCLPEGQLARMRAAVVSQTGLAKLARKIELGNYVLLGKGESRDGGAE